MSRRRKPTKQPARCSCNRHVDTPLWVGARRTGSGVGMHKAPVHGNPFTAKNGCVHSELIRTSRARKKCRGVTRLRVA